MDVPNRQDPYLSQADEARLVGVSEALVCRYRREPAHPIHNPDLRTGIPPHAAVRTSAILTYWQQAKTRRPGNPRKPSWPRDLLSKRQWQTLLAIHTDPEAPVKPFLRERLTARGLLDSAGKPTAEALALIDQYQPTS